MRVINKEILDKCKRRHANSRSSMDAWLDYTTKAAWKTPADIQSDFRTASILPNNRVVFNIKGNDYRLVVRINYDLKIVEIRFAGTHAEYSRIEANTV